MPVPQIGDYALIGNGRAAALVSRDGSIDWLCWPRFDSPSLFAAILDADKGGSWRVAPRGRYGVERAYVGDSNVLATTFETARGRARLIDLMPVEAEDDKKHRLVPEHELLRVVECDAGEVEIDIQFRPRPLYGCRAARLYAAGALGIRLEDGSSLYTLRSDRPLVVRDSEAVGKLTLRAGERGWFSLSFDRDGPAVLTVPSLETVDRTVAWWTRWAGRCCYDGAYRAQVVRSLLALKLLSYAPSGALVAAPTTSLPERLGGDLNWDYRFCWLRDASLTVRVLADLGYVEEASAFLNWMLHTTRLTRPELRVVYDVYGRLPKDEEVLDHLEGHRRSPPVRIRNAAALQLQLDAYGEVIDAVACMIDRTPRLDRATRAMLRELGRYVSDNWWRPDHGIWEGRDEPQGHTHSLLLCWTALDRLLELDARGVFSVRDRKALSGVRERIRRSIEERGYSTPLQSYTQTLGGSTVDASLLLMSRYGFAAPDDARLRHTYERIRERLEVAPSLLFRTEESLRAGEGAFGICCFWATDYLARGGGSIDAAAAHFERLLPYANDVGLYGEEIDPASGAPLGNFPQAFTHVGLIGAAVALEERQRQEAQR